MTTTISGETIKITGHVGVRLEKYRQLFGWDSLDVRSFDPKKDEATFEPLTIAAKDYLTKRADSPDKRPRTTTSITSFEKRYGT